VAITVKKKSLKLKSNTPANGATEESAVTEEEGAVVAAVMPASGSASRKGGGSFVPFVIMGLLACGLLGGLIAMQVIENSFYTGAIPQAGAIATP
jgi:hypothetical protein